MNNVPNLRFKEFSGEWESQPLSKLGTFFKGTGLSKADLSDEGNPCVLYGELYTKYTEVITNVKSKTNVELGNAVIGKINDVLIPSSGETAVDIATASCLQQDDVILGGDLNVFRSNQVNGIFTSYQLNTSKKFEIAKLAQGASVVHVYNDQLKKLKLSVPTIEEQEKIASFFSLIDKKIELQTEKVEELKNYKKGIMQKIFSQELRFKDEDGNEYPEWEERKLGNLINEYEYKTDSNNKYPILSSTLNGIVLQSNYFSKQTASVDTTGYKIVPRGYFTYRSMSDTGVFRFNMQEVVDFGIVSPAYPVFASSDKINSKFLELVLNHSPGVKRQLLITKEGGTRYALGFKKLKQIQVMIPCKLEQEKIAILIRNLDSKVNKEEQKLVALIDYKKGLLQQMFI